MTHAIILHNDVPIDVRAFAPLIAGFLGITVIEAKMRIRKGRGIFLQGLDRSVAGEISVALREGRVFNDVVEDGALSLLPPMRKLTFVSRDDSMLCYRKSAGSFTEALAWEEIAIVGAGIIPVGQYADLFASVKFEHLPSIRDIDDRESQTIVRERMIEKTKVERFKSIVVKNADNVFDELDKKFGKKIKIFVDLVSRDFVEWLRIDMYELAYEVKQGTAKFGGSWGMKYIMEDIRAHVSKESMTQCLAQFIDGNDPNLLIFGDVEEFNRYLLWSLARRSLLKGV